jgi:hypothetical protein
MNILVTDPYNIALSDALTDAVQSAGLTVTPINLGLTPEAIDRFRLGRVPCVARIYNGRAVYVTDDTNAVATFDADADAVVAAIEAEA